MLVSRIHKTYLINEFAPDAEKLKLKPTENNKEALRHILNSTDLEEFKGYSKIIENFDYFKSAITPEKLRVRSKNQCSPCCGILSVNGNYPLCSSLT